MLKACKTCLMTQSIGLSLVCLHLGKLSAMNCDSVRRVHVRRGSVLQALLCGLHLASYASALCCVRAEAWTPVHALYHSISHSLSPSQYQISPMFCTVRVNCSTGAVSLDISGPANFIRMRKCQCSACARACACSCSIVRAAAFMCSSVCDFTWGAVATPASALRRERLLFVQLSLSLGLCPCWCQLLFKCHFLQLWLMQKQRADAVSADDGSRRLGAGHMTAARDVAMVRIRQRGMG